MQTFVYQSGKVINGEVSCIHCAGFSNVSHLLKQKISPLLHKTLLYVACFICFLPIKNRSAVRSFSLQPSHS